MVSRGRRLRNSSSMRMQRCSTGLCSPRVALTRAASVSQPSVFSLGQSQIEPGRGTPAVGDPSHPHPRKCFTPGQGRQGGRQHLGKSHALPFTDVFRDDSVQVPDVLLPHDGRVPQTYKGTGLQGPLWDRPGGRGGGMISQDPIMTEGRVLKVQGMRLGVGGSVQNCSVQ